MSEIENNSTIELLSQFAKQTNRKITYSEEEYDGNAIHPVVYHKRSF
jgi:hypothetical protein